MLETAFAPAATSARKTTTEGAYDSRVRERGPRRFRLSKPSKESRGLQSRRHHARPTRRELSTPLPLPESAARKGREDPRLRPVLRARARAATSIDDEGKRYLDLLSGFGVFALGRSHPVIKDALHQALDADLPNMVQMDCALLPGLLAEQLVTRSPKQIERVFFCNSGAEAVEAAIKFARATLSGVASSTHSHAYHGLTMGALALNGSTEFKRGFGPLLPDTTEDPLRRRRRAARRAREGRRRGASSSNRSRARASTSSTRNAGASSRPPCTRRARCSSATRCRRASVAPAAFYAFEHYGLAPDIITVSKALSGGYVPVGAMLTSDKHLSQRLQLDGSSHGALDHVQGQSNWPWSRDSPRSRSSTTRSIIDHAAAMGDVWHAAARRTRGASRVPPRDSRARAR